MDMDRHKTRLHDYAYKNAPWLSSVLFKGIRVGALPKWVPFCGIYLPFVKAIYVKSDEYAEIEFGTLVHEYRHAWQRYEWGWFRYLVKKAFCRKKIEADAEEWELNGVEWCGDTRSIEVISHNIGKEIDR